MSETILYQTVEFNTIIEGSNIIEIINGIINNCPGEGNNLEITQIIRYYKKPTTQKELLKQLDISDYFRCKDKNVTCTICLNDVQPTEYVRDLKCNHSFHKKCIDKWLLTNLKCNNEMNCPLCRKKIDLVI